MSKPRASSPGQVDPRDIDVPPASPRRGKLGEEY